MSMLGSTLKLKKLSFTYFTKKDFKELKYVNPNYDFKPIEFKFKFRITIGRFEISWGEYY